MYRNTAGNSNYSNVPGGKIAKYTQNGVIFVNAPKPRKLSWFEILLRAIFG